MNSRKTSLNGYLNVNNDGHRSPVFLPFSNLSAVVLETRTRPVGVAANTTATKTLIFPKILTTYKGYSITSFGCQYKNNITVHTTNGTKYYGHVLKILGSHYGAAATTKIIHDVKIYIQNYKTNTVRTGTRKSLDENLDKNVSTKGTKKQRKYIPSL